MSSYPSIVPYLLVQDAKALIAFLESGFGGKARLVMPSEHGVKHGEVELGDSLIMLSDASDLPRAPIHLCLYVKDVDAIYEKALAAGAVSLSEPKTQDYGQRMAAVTDPAGNTWWICGEIA
jgi:uncharacterized glyoxalase superfamily protein PhnB